MGLGTNRLTQTKQNVELIRQAVAAGVGLVDTAHLYTGGQSEETIGAALTAPPDRCVVATKGGFRPGEGRPEVLREQIERAREVVPIVAVQNRYNLSERQHDEVVDHCAREGLVFVPFFPLGGDGGRPLVEIAGQRGATPAQIALAWLLKRSPAMLPIPGTLSIAHLEENLAALELELSEAEYRALL